MTTVKIASKTQFIMIFVTLQWFSLLSCGNMWNMHVRGERAKVHQCWRNNFITFSFCCQLVKDIQHVSGFLYHDSRNYKKVKCKCNEVWMAKMILYERWRVWTFEEFLLLEDNATDWCLNRDMSRPTGFVFLGLES